MGRKSMKQWGKRLAAVLKSRGLSQGAVARALGVSQQSVSKWMAGREIEHNHLMRLAKLLGINWAWLRYGDEAMINAMEREGWSDMLSVMRQQLLENAEQLEHNFRTVATLLNFGYWEINYFTRRNYWSITTRMLLDVPMNLEATQVAFREIVHKDDVVHIDETIRMARNGRIFWQHFRLRANPELTLYCIGRAMKSKGGKTHKVLGLIFDKSIFINAQLPVVADLFGLKLP